MACHRISRKVESGNRCTMMDASSEGPTGDTVNAGNRSDDVLGFPSEAPKGAPQDDDDFSVGDVPLEATTDTPNPAAKKRRRIGSPSAEIPTYATLDDSPEQKDVQIELAKKKLSKWAARLFDPDRPRGLIEPPKTIPLNDEFLTAFGKREKEFDQSVGRKIDIDTSKLDDEDDNDSETDEPAAEGKAQEEKKTMSSVEGRKVKITNLAYTTKQETLEAACQVYGPCVEVNLLMDKEKPELNVGRAYVTFETIGSANACMEKMDRLDGRQLRVSIAVENPDRKRRSTAGQVRYWENDISTKCFRCGQVGHMVSSCPNEAKQKPCPLCATPGHEFYACPLSKICFNCGVPGHVSRDCGQRRGLPKRKVCGTCFQSGHHRVQCRRRAFDADTHDARCMVCGELGHFMCKDMKWFFGLQGVTCFNCGRQGHHGFDCERPGLTMCAREPQVGEKEIERAQALSLADELEKQKSTENSSSRHRGRGRGDERDYSRRDERDYNRGRAKSQPPPRDSGRGYDDGRGGNNSRRGYPSQSQRRNSREGGRGYREGGRQSSDGRRGYL